MSFSHCVSIAVGQDLSIWFFRRSCESRRQSRLSGKIVVVRKDIVPVVNLPQTSTDGLVKGVSRRRVDGNIRLWRGGVLAATAMMAGLFCGSPAQAQSALCPTSIPAQPGIVFQ